MQVYCIDTLSFLQEAHMLFSVDRYDAHQLQISRRLFLVLVAHTDTCRLSLLEIFCLSSCSHDMFVPLRTRRYNYIYIYTYERKEEKDQPSSTEQDERRKSRQIHASQRFFFGHRHLPKMPIHCKVLVRVLQFPKLLHLAALLFLHPLKLRRMPFPSVLLSIEWILHLALLLELPVQNLNVAEFL